MSSDMLTVPLEPSQSRFLLEMSRRCKEEDLLTGDERKALFQAGRYPNWYSSRLEKIVSILEILLENFTAKDDQVQISEILDVLGGLNIELGQLEFDAKDSAETPAARFRRAEIYFENGENDASRVIFEELLKSGHDTEEVKFYLRKLSNG